MKQYKSRDKITQKMTRDGLIEVNETQQTAERISKREQDADFQKSPEQQAAQDGTQLQGVASQTSPLPHAPGASPARDTATAERVMEHIEAAQTRRASKKAVHKAQEEVTVQTTSSRLQFTEEELAVPELECYIEKSNKAADRLDAAKAAIPKQNYSPSFSTSEISFAVAVTIRMPVSLISSRSASSCRRCVSFAAGVSNRNWSTDIW